VIHPERQPRLIEEHRDEVGLVTSSDQIRFRTSSRRIPPPACTMVSSTSAMPPRPICTIGS
jgi:hypothetical protein